MNVSVVGMTIFRNPSIGGWEPEEFNGSNLVEFAGRACYASWNRPNPATATNEGYIKHILDVGHFSVLEHATVSFYIQDVSRSLTHELVRHRHFNYSQLSQRYVDSSTATKTIPPDAENDHEAWLIINESWDQSMDAYNKLVKHFTEKLEDLEPDKLSRRKRARQAARSVMPNMTNTSIVVTGNYRAWRHFLAMRATEAADLEIRRLAVEIWEQLKTIAPAVFNDFQLQKSHDGSYYLTTTTVGDSKE